MPKAKQTAKTETATVAKGAADVPKVDVTVVADTKKGKAKAVAAKTVKGAAEVKDTVVMTKNEVVDTVTATDAEVETGDVVLSETFGAFLQKLQALASQMNVLKTEFRTLEKKAVRELKTAQKVQAKKASGNRPLPVCRNLISDELASPQKPLAPDARTEVS